MSRAKTQANTSNSEAGSKPAAGWRGIWSGTLSFSLVAIPVQLVSAVTPGRVALRTLHRQDYAPLVRRMFCPADKVLVPPEEIVRGYEIGPEKYLVVTDEELESVSPERSRTIEIAEFVELSDIEPIYFDQPYYLVPARGGGKSYRLLVEILARTHKAGLARFVLHDREHLVAVISTAGALVLITMHYTADILPAADIAPEAVPVDDRERDRLKKQIAEMLTDFDPGRYADGRREKILALLKRKAAVTTPVAAPASGAAGAGEGPADLVAALEESMRRLKQNQ